MAPLISSPVGEVPADGYLMVASNEIHIIGNLVGRRSVMCRKSSSAETESAAGDGELHLARSVSECIDTDICGREERYIRPSNRRAIHRQPECVDCVGTDQIGAAKSI